MDTNGLPHSPDQARPRGGQKTQMSICAIYYFDVQRDKKEKRLQMYGAASELGESLLTDSAFLRVIHLAGSSGSVHFEAVRIP